MLGGGKTSVKGCLERAVTTGSRSRRSDLTEDELRVSTKDVGLFASLSTYIENPCEGGLKAECTTFANTFASLEFELWRDAVGACACKEVNSNT